MYDDLLNELRGLSFDIGQEFMENSESCSDNIDRLSFSVNLNLGINGLDILMSLVKDEVSQEVTRKIFKYIRNNGHKKFIDIIAIPKFKTTLENELTFGRFIAKSLLSINPNYIVTNGRIGSTYFMDLGGFNHTLGPSGGGSCYRIGSISNMIVYVDPFSKWTDNYMLLFDRIHFNMSNFNYKIVNGSTFTPKIEIGFDLKFDVINPMVVFCFEEDYKNNIEEYYSIKLSFERDIKIKNILDEELGSNSTFGLHGIYKLES